MVGAVGLDAPRGTKSDRTVLGVLLVGRRSSARVIELAQYAEQLDFDVCWVADERFLRDVYPLCTAVAGATRSVRIGPCVTDPYSRHPALTATAIATLDEISGRRAILGIGAGASGMREMALTRAHPARTISDAVRLIRGLLDGNRVAIHSDFGTFDGALGFTPLGRVPIYVAAGGRHVQEAAGAVGDGAILQACMTDVELAWSSENLRRGATAVGRDPSTLDIVARIDVAVDDELERAYDALRHRVARIAIRDQPTFRRFTRLGLSVSPRLAELVRGLGYTHEPAVLAPVAAEITNDLVDAFCVAATPAGLAARLAIPMRHGIRHFIIHPIPTRGDDVEGILRAVRATRP